MTDIVALCRAYVDLIVPVSHEELRSLGFLPNQDYYLSNEDILELCEVYTARGELLAGGPGANTISGVNALGGSATFIGKVSNDSFGRFFTEEFNKADITFNCNVIEDNMTARCVIFVLPNGTRTITYNPSIADKVTLEDIELNKDALTQTKIFYMGWLNREYHCKNVVNQTLELTKSAQRVSSLQSYGSRLNDDFSAISQADIILGNHGEFDLFLDDMKVDSLDSLSRAYPDKIFACTLGADGADIYNNSTRHHIEAIKPAQIIDTTGAGDAWAAGFLYGIAKEFSIEKSGKLGALCAAEIITHNGGRPQGNWHNILKRLNV